MPFKITHVSANGGSKPSVESYSVTNAEEEEQLVHLFTAEPKKPWALEIPHNNSHLCHIVTSSFSNIKSLLCLCRVFVKSRHINKLPTIGSCLPHCMKYTICMRFGPSSASLPTCACIMSLQFHVQIADCEELNVIKIMQKLHTHLLLLKIASVNMG